MHKSTKLIRKSIIPPQTLIHKQRALQLLLTKLPLIPVAFIIILRLRSSPLLLNIGIAQSPEADTPALKNDDFNRRCAFGVHGLPLAVRSLVACAIEGAFVVAWDFDVGFASCEGGEESFAEFDVVG